MALDRFELLELRRDDGIQTFHAREVSTARPVQVHLFTSGNAPENLALLARVNRLPDAERRRVIDRGVSGGRFYLVTDRLAGFAGLREWLESKAAPASLDQQFFALFDPEAPQAPPQSPAGDGEARTGSPVGAFALGILFALLFLAVVIAAFVFHPR